jgi:hypothetical protein
MADSPDEPRLYEEELVATVHATATGTSSVTRGLNETRLAVLGIMVMIALGSAALASGWWQRLAVGLGAFAVSAAAIGLPWSRNYLMAFMHKLTGS